MTGHSPHRNTLTAIVAATSLWLVGVLGDSTALAAIGRTAGQYAVSPSGEATYTIPLFAPPGAAGLEPSLALVYGHRAGGSWLGEGWGVSGLSAITRCPKTWAQDGLSREVKLDATDRYCLDGAQLKGFLGTYGGDGALYRTEREQFASIESFTGSGATGGPASFTVKTKDGLIYEYGARPDSRIEALGTTTVAVWALSTIRDRSDNRIEFYYTEDTTYGSYQITTVEWSSNPTVGTGAVYRTEFVYETQLPGEIESGYLAGTGVRDVLRMTRVDVTHLSTGTLVRRYALAYEPNLSSTSRSRLQSVTECAGAGGSDCLAPLAFTYTDGTNGIAAAAVTGVTTPAPAAMLTMDVNGDGRTDLVYPSTATSGTGVWMVALAHSGGGFATPLASPVPNTQFTRAIPIDYNADGLEDLLYPDGANVWQVALGTTGGLGAASGTGIAATGATAAALDVNGDGLEDLVEFETQAVRYRLRETSGSFGAEQVLVQVLQPGEFIDPIGLGQAALRRRARHPDFNGDGHGDLLIGIQLCDWQTFNCSYFHHAVLGGTGGLVWVVGYGGTLDPIFADLNGDRYTDIVNPGTTTEYWYGTGVGFVQGSPVSFAQHASGAPALVADWDQDGYEDVLARGADGNWWVLRATGIGLAAPFSSGVAGTGATHAYAADVNGDDLDDVIFAGAGGAVSFHLHSGARADLLKTATDGYGNVVTFSYVSIAQSHYTKYADAVRVGQAGWAGYFDYQGPLYVVSQYTATDGTDGNPNTLYTISYWYYGAWMHRQGRGFAGFYAVRPHDSRNGNVVYEYFRRDYPFTGQLFFRDVLVQGIRLGSRELVDFSFALLGLGNNNDYGTEVRQFTYSPFEERLEYEAGGTYYGELRVVATTRLFEFLGGSVYDQTVTTTESDSANGVYPNGVHTLRTWHSQPALNDTAAWCLGRPTEVSVTASHTQNYGAAQTRKTGTSWDAAYCRPTQTVLEPGNPTLSVATALGYDAFGNVNSETVTGAGMAARSTTTNWGASGQFPISISRAVNASFSEVTLQGWNYATGTQSSVTDPNGLETTYQYDAFNRRTVETAPDGTYTVRTLGYCGAGSGCDARIRMYYTLARYSASGNVVLGVSGAHLDAQDRPINDLQYNLAGSWVAVSRHFDALGREIYESVPYLWGGGPVWASTFYDALNRPTSTWRYVSSTDFNYQIVSYGYSGLTSSVTDEQGKQRVTIANAIGKTARSIDHAGYWQGFDWDAFGNAKRVYDAASVVLQENTFNLRGFRTASSDVDLGSWTYAPNALGEVTSQVDANGTVATMSYDGLGRLMQKVETIPGQSSITRNFAYGQSAAAKNVGQLAGMDIYGTGISTYSESHAFDALGRLIQTVTVAGTDTFQVNRGYWPDTGQLATLEYPSSTAGYRHKVQYEYQYGRLLRARNYANPAEVYWQAVADDPRGNITDELLGNGLRTQRAFDAVSGYLGSIRTGPNGGTPTTIQNLAYGWDRVGNLKSRADLNQGLTEALWYDDLHRLDYSQLNGSTNLDLSYQPNGNIATRTESGGATLSYTYHPSKIHAVTGVNGGGTSLAYTYDGNGNVTAKNGAAVAWLAQNKPRSISNGTYTSTFEYTPDERYWKQVGTYANGTETSIYIGGLLEKVTTPTDTFWRHHVKAGDRTVAIVSRAQGGTNATIYPLADHLGSVEAITDSAGALLVRESFAAFGARRGSNWQGQPSSADMTAIANATRRGFTDHSMLDNIGLVHMNGRVYDPQIGRFLSADPFIPGSLNTQAWNRYSYVGNNPLSYTDPSGYFSLKRFFRSITRFIVREAARWALNAILPGLGDVALQAYSLRQSVRSRDVIGAFDAIAGLRTSFSNLGASPRAGDVAFRGFDTGPTHRNYTMLSVLGGGCNGGTVNDCGGFGNGLYRGVLDALRDTFTQGRRPASPREEPSILPAVAGTFESADAAAIAFANALGGRTAATGREYGARIYQLADGQFALGQTAVGPLTPKEVNINMVPERADGLAIGWVHTHPSNNPFAPRDQQQTISDANFYKRPQTGYVALQNGSVQSWSTACAASLDPRDYGQCNRTVR